MLVIQPDTLTNALPNTSIRLYIGKHLLDAHGDKKLINENQFRVLKKCHGKFESLVYERLFIKELRPSLNIQSDSISAKLFVWLVAYFITSLS